MAELLYLEHTFEPLNSPFFDMINNKYAYMSHDDGWLLMLYLKQFQELGDIIANKVTGMISTLKRITLHPFPEAVKEKLAALSKDGFLIDFSNINRRNGSVEVRIYTIGEFSDMDTMYHEHQKHMYPPAYSASLEQKNKTWSICYESHPE